MWYVSSIWLRDYLNHNHSLKNTKEIREIRDNYELLSDKVDLVLNEDFKGVFMNNLFL